jgi:hypothetical protein
MKTITITLIDVKGTDIWSEVLFSAIPLKEGVEEEEEEDPETLARREALSERYFQYGEYANLELTIDESMNIVSGRIIPQR